MMQNMFKQDIRIIRLLVLLIILVLVFSISGCTAKTGTEEAGGERNEELVRSFIEALTTGDGDKAIGFLGNKMSYTERYVDGSEYEATKKDELEFIISTIVNRDTSMTADQIEVVDYSTVIIQGKAKDFITELAGLSDGIRYTMEFEIKNNQISRIQFERNEEDEAFLNQQTEGKIGVYIEELEDNVTIMECMPGKAAEKAGLKIGDVIKVVNGVGVSDMKHGIEEVSVRIGGPVGSKVFLIIDRKGEMLQMEVERENPLSS